jgi:hypothetical protein
MTQAGMFLTDTNPAPQKCPVSFNTGKQPPAPAMDERLMRVSEVARTSPQSSPLACVLEWMHEFLARAHPDLGRKGAVCPFVPLSLEQDFIWMAEIADGNATVDSIATVISRFRDLFLATEPTSGPDTINKAFVVVFPNLGTDGAGVIDEVQTRLKRDFVDMGLMLGEFHATNQSPGLRNADFRPLRSPIPMLAMRHMVDSDLPFLLRYVYKPDERSAFLRSYLFRLAGTLGQAKFDQALDGVIEAEIEKWIAKADEGQAE